MNEKVAKVLNGFIGLSVSERAEFIREFNRYQNSQSWEKPSIERSITESAKEKKKNTICTCCGR